MKLWTLKKFATGKYDKVELQRNVLGFYRVVWTKTNHFPQPPSETLYLLTGKRAAWVFGNISGLLASICVIKLPRLTSQRLTGCMSPMGKRYAHH